MTQQMLSRAVDGTVLERRRLALGLSRERLAAAAGDFSAATIKRVERGEVKPQPSTLAAILAALNRAEDPTA
jgi:transcriptional regulator with XRE-family HTH domain